MAVISQNLEQLGQNFALHSGTIQDMYMSAKYHQISIYKNEGTRSGTKIPESNLDPPTAEVAAAASNLSNTFRSPCTLDVGPKY